MNIQLNDTTFDRVLLANSRWLITSSKALGDEGALQKWDLKRPDLTLGSDGTGLYLKIDGTLPDLTQEPPTPAGEPTIVELYDFLFI